MTTVTERIRTVLSGLTGSQRPTVPQFYITTCGRSGSHWLVHILNDLGITVVRQDRFRRELIHPSKWKETQADGSPFWTHWIAGDALTWDDWSYEWWKDVRLPVISLLRDPRDVAISVYHYKRTKYRWEGTIEDAIHNVKFVFTRPAIRKLHMDPAVHQLRYESLKETPVDVLTRLLTFIGVERERATIEADIEKNSFKMQSGGRDAGVEVYVDAEEHQPAKQRKGIIGDWKNYDADWAQLADCAHYYGYHTA